MKSMNIVVICIVALSGIKLIYMFFNKQGFNRFIKSYYKIMYNYPWLFHNIYIGLSILILYALRQYGMTYTELLCAMMLFGFMVNAAFTAYPKEMFENLTLEKINYSRIITYIIIFIFIMFKAIQEINF